MDLRELLDRYRKEKQDAQAAALTPRDEEVVAACLWFLVMGFSEIAAGFAFTQTPEFQAAVQGMMKQMGVGVVFEGGDEERVH